MSLPRGDGAARSSVPHSGVTVWWSARLIWVRSPCDPSRKLFYFSLETMWRHYDDRSSCYRPCWPAWPGVVPGVPRFDAFLAPARHQRVTISGRRCGVWGPVGPTRSPTSRQAQWVSKPAPGHQGRHHRRGDPQTAFRHLLPVSGCFSVANAVKPR